MLEKNQHTRAALESLLDAALLFAAYVLANYLRFNFLRFFQPGGAGPAGRSAPPGGPAARPRPRAQALPVSK